LTNVYEFAEVQSKIFKGEDALAKYEAQATEIFEKPVTPNDTKKKKLWTHFNPFETFSDAFHMAIKWGCSLNKIHKFEGIYYLPVPE
jgi:hypothetical protein